MTFVSQERVESPDRPIGPVVDGRPARRPEAAVIKGRHGRIETLSTRHAPDLWAALRGHDWIWTYMPSYGPFADEESFSQWIASRVTLEDPFSYAVVDTDGRARGIATLVEARPAMRVIEVGHIVYAPALQRTALATEAQFLLACYVFETLGYRRYEWKCDALNTPSRRAALRLGFRFEGIFRQHMIAKGRNRDTAWYSMLDGEWPACKTALEGWLAPQNFHPDGTQKVRLSALMQGDA